MGNLAVISARIIVIGQDGERDSYDEPVRFIYGETIQDVYNKLKCYGDTFCYMTEGDTAFQEVLQRVVEELNPLECCEVQYEPQPYLMFIEEGVLTDPSSNILNCGLFNDMPEKFTPACLKSIKLFMENIDKEFKNEIKNSFPKIRDSKDHASLLRFRNFSKSIGLKQ